MTKGSDFYGVGTKYLRSILLALSFSLSTCLSFSASFLLFLPLPRSPSPNTPSLCVRYNIFAGHDATYGLGKMSLETVDLDKDASGLTTEEMAAVDKFYNLFMSKYTPVGKYVSNSKM